MELQPCKATNTQTYKILCKIKGMKCACSSPVQFTLFLCTSLLHNIFHSQRKSFYDFFRDSIFCDFLFILLTIFACIVSAKFLNCNIYMAHGHKLQRFRAREVCFLLNCIVLNVNSLFALFDNRNSSKAERNIK